MNIDQKKLEKSLETAISNSKIGSNFFYFLKNYMSNFQRCRFVENGLVFTNTEQYFMYHKAIFFKDNDTAIKILATTNPFDAKAYGREVKNYIDYEWDKVRYKVMYDANWLKYTQNKDLADKLLATGNTVLVECNPTDKIWAIAMSIEEARNSTPNQWRGQNLLGLVLMEVRTNLTNRVK